MPNPAPAAVPNAGAFRALVERAPQAVALLDADGAVRYANPAAERVLGFAAEDLVGRRFLDLVPEHDRDRVADAWAAALAAPGREVTVAHGAEQGDGACGRLESAFANLLADPQVGAVAAYLRDAPARETPLAEAQAARRAAEANAAALAELNRLGQMLAGELDQERLLQAVVDAAVALTGAAFGAFFYNAVDDRGDVYALYVLSGAAREAFARFPMPRPTAVFGPTFRGEGPVRLADVRADPRFGRNPPYRGTPAGHLPVVSYLAVPVVSRAGEVLGGLFFGHPQPGVFDRRAEELAVGLAAHAAVALDNARLLRRTTTSEARLRGLFEGVADAILVADAERRYVDANPAAEELLGYARDELVGMRVDDVVTAGPGWTETEYARYLETGRWRGELTLRRKDGSTAPVEARASVVDLPGGPLYLSAVRDVSERRRLEELRRDFLAMVTHDLRTPLTAVRGFAQLLRMRGEYRAAAVEAILGQADRMQRLLDDLADVVKAEAGLMGLRRGPTDLVEVARREAAAQAQVGSHRIEVVAPGEPVVGAWDGERLGQVLANLLGNAVKYSPAGGRVTVAVAAEGAEARLVVRDEGPGIAPEHLPRLFERFYRVDGDGSGGLGLGLYIARLIVEAHGGRVEADSEPGRGSAFTVRLPIVP